MIYIYLPLIMIGGNSQYSDDSRAGKDACTQHMACLTLVIYSKLHEHFFRLIYKYFFFF